jgi:hypothetical protein
MKTMIFLILLLNFSCASYQGYAENGIGPRSKDALRRLTTNITNAPMNFVVKTWRNCVKPAGYKLFSFCQWFTGKKIIRENAQDFLKVSSMDEISGDSLLLDFSFSLVENHYKGCKDEKTYFSCQLFKATLLETSVKIVPSRILKYLLTAFLLHLIPQNILVMYGWKLLINWAIGKFIIEPIIDYFNVRHWVNLELKTFGIRIC